MQVHGLLDDEISAGAFCTFCIGCVDIALVDSIFLWKVFLVSSF